MGYTTITPGTTIASDWGNEVRDQLVTPFVSGSSRSSQVVTPVSGMVSTLTTANFTNGIEIYNGTSWRKPWNLPWGLGHGSTATSAYAATSSTRQTITTAGTDLTGLSVTINQTSARILKFTLMIGVLAVNAGATAFNFTINTGASGAGTSLGALGESKLSLGDYRVFSYSRIITTSATTASQQYHARLATLTANGIEITNDLGLGTLICEDMGPAGAPV